MFLGLLSVIGHYVGRIPRKRVPVHCRSVDAGVIKPFTVILWHFNVVSNFGSIGWFGLDRGVDLHFLLRERRAEVPKKIWNF